MKALENAYSQQVRALNEKLDPKEVDPERRKIALALYRQAADDAESILGQMSMLEDALTDKKDMQKKAFFGVEDQLKKK